MFHGLRLFCFKRSMIGIGYFLPFEHHLWHFENRFRIGFGFLPSVSGCLSFKCTAIILLHSYIIMWWLVCGTKIWVATAQLFHYQLFNQKPEMWNPIRWCWEKNPRIVISLISLVTILVMQSINNRYTTLVFDTPKKLGKNLTRVLFLGWIQEDLPEHDQGANGGSLHQVWQRWDRKNKLQRILPNVEQKEVISKLLRANTFSYAYCSLAEQCSAIQFEIILKQYGVLMKTLSVFRFIFHFY